MYEIDFIEFCIKFIGIFCILHYFINCILIGHQIALIHFLAIFINFKCSFFFFLPCCIKCKNTCATISRAGRIFLPTSVFLCIPSVKHISFSCWLLSRYNKCIQIFLLLCRREIFYQITGIFVINNGILTVIHFCICKSVNGI